MWDWSLGKTFSAKHRTVLSLPCAPSIYSVPYWADSKRRKRKSDELTKLVKSYVAEPEVAGWSSQVFYEHKNNSSFCSCVDHLCLNNIIVRDKYLISCIEERIDYRGKVRVFFNLVANSGYGQIEMDKIVADETVSLVDNGLNLYNWVFFELRIATVTF